MHFEGLMHLMAALAASSKADPYNRRPKPPTPPAPEPAAAAPEKVVLHLLLPETPPKHS